MMPAWLARLLPHAGLVLALAAALWWSDRQGHERAMAQRDARDAIMLDRMRAALRQSEQRLAVSIEDAAATYRGQRAAIARAETVLHALIREETARDPRLSDPAAGLTPGLLDAVNRARAAGACAPAAAGRIDCALPASAASAESHGR